MRRVNTITGKALLTITREDSKWVPFYVRVDILECSSDEYEPYEDFDLLSTDTLPCPDAAYDLKVGETVNVLVEYSFLWTKDYFGEVDVDLEYTDQKVVAEGVEE